ncbi:MAG TPA: hypothetical protein VM681_11115 [Candidatus Thermoplasmatota archaeon]|nr:hypothetical protein [Candidatus Thermoplasmatota archaeon]
MNQNPRLASLSSIALLLALGMLAGGAVAGHGTDPCEGPGLPAHPLSGTEYCCDVSGFPPEPSNCRGHLRMRL